MCRQALQQVITRMCGHGPQGNKGPPNPTCMFYKYRQGLLKYAGILEDYWVTSGHTTSSWEGHINTLRE